MDRSDWIKQMRREAEQRYDTIWAPLYGEKWGLYPNKTHQLFIRKLLSLLPQPGRILDAACGAGRYVPMLLEGGHTVIGIDQSQGMLSRLRQKFPTVQVEKVGLQEIRYRELFDGTICMDAMEHVFPEDWALVLGNFQRALKPSGTLYFTVEIASEAEIEAAFQRSQGLGLPVVFGEWPDGDVYHYYPPMWQVKDWIQAAGLELIEEAEGDDYHHFLARTASAGIAGQPITG
jgi:SAM-dependent methyltransferase